MANQRILQAVAATLRSAFLDSNGNPSDPTGPVTVHVTHADGTDVLAAGTSATLADDQSGGVSVALTSAATAQLNLLTAVWSDAASGAVVTSRHEIVGGFLFSVSEARKSDPSLEDTGRYPDQLIVDKRTEVEEELEWICDVAFVPRYTRTVLDGTGTNEILFPDNELRDVRSVRIYSSIGNSPQFTDLTADDITKLDVDSEGTMVARTNYKIWDLGQGNITVEYEHGYDAPAAQLKAASLVRLRSLLNWNKAGIPDNATSFQLAEGGGAFRLDLPTKFKTGLTRVDAVYARYSRRSLDAYGPVPVSMPLRFEQNRYSLFHGGRH